MTTLTPVIALVAIYSMLAASFFLVVRMGEISFGQQAWFGIGAYAASILTTVAGWHLAPAVAVAALSSAAVAAAVGAIALRLTGFQFSVFTLIVAEFVRQLAGEATWRVPAGDRLVGPEGAMGFAGIDWFARNGWGPLAQAGLLALIAAITFAGLHRMARGKYGRLLAAVSADRELAEARGLPARGTRHATYVAAAAIASVSGALFAHYVTFIDPDNFGIMAGVHALAYSLIGGTAHVLGPLLGTLIDVTLLESLRIAGSYRMVAFGTLLVLCLVLLPKGILSRRAATRTSL